MSRGNVHGYDPRENERLQNQAGTLVELLHWDTSYLAGSRVLEAGCGVGAQTLTLARNSPHARITCVDLSEASLAQAKRETAYFYPDNEAAHEAIRCRVELQRAAGGNAMIGRQLYPLLTTAGFSEVRVSPRMVYVDSSKPELIDGFTRKTFTAMIEGVRESALEAGIVDPEVFDRGIRDLYATAGSNGVFCYTFFKAVAYRGAA